MDNRQVTVFNLNIIEGEKMTQGRKLAVIYTIFCLFLIGVEIALDTSSKEIPKKAGM